ncbi:MAG: histidinol-phosphatase HisJ family protein [Collinsella sp.]|nr:histidinol-phosphatase HisJ family protein [Collinsella sp.]
MIADYHVHSEFSVDSTYPMDQVCSHAMELGIDELCFTDHVDYGVQPDVSEYEIDPSYAPLEDGKPLLNVDYERYFPTIELLRSQFADRLSVRTGLEFGVQTHTVGRFNELFDRYADRIDFIIMSVHQIQNQEFWNHTYQTGRSQMEYNRGYYEELLEVARRYDNWSVLGHLDLIKRYDTAGILPDEEVHDLIAEILRTVIEKGKGIEVNTSSFRYGLPDLQPSTYILKLYRDLGGRVITMGSDSHKPEHLGAHIGEVRERLRDLGFTEFCTFRHMEPRFHRL